MTCEVVCYVKARSTKSTTGMIASPLPHLVDLQEAKRPRESREIATSLFYRYSSILEVMKVLKFATF